MIFKRYTTISKYIYSLLKVDVTKVFAGDVLSKVLLLIIHIFLIKNLTVNNYAELTLMLNGVLLGYQLACAPLERVYLSSETPEKFDFVKIKYALSIISSFFIFFWLYGKISLNNNLIIFLGVIILSNQQFIRILAQKKMKFTLFSIIEIFKNVFWLSWILLIFYVIDLQQPILIILGLILSSLVISIIYKSLFFQSKKSVSNNKKNTFKDSILSIKFVILYSSLTSLIPYIPIFFISENTDLLSTYGAALRYLAMLSMAVYAFNVVFLPKMSSLRAHEQVEKVNRFRKTIPVIIICFLFFVIFVGSIVSFINHDKYHNLVSIFYILSLTSFFSLLTVPYINLLLILGYDKEITSFVFISLIISILSYFIIKKVFIIHAPAISSVICYSCIFFLCFLKVSTLPKKET
ncbi:hypothetical protein ABF228_003252 [Yersinia ruckeri]|uniref:lipopolysaccharide biosynthesis protein n=1 Tax=Yersinia ruckeri TaxID=29486 RepID=UPI0020BF1458|nr:hypothetical protein [Yersinia ruckeri]EKN4183852.1 hypothetical protein [Yersinia ruckeri]EKN4696646.1 hypothetical protein [Yersinia ruckeri]MCK8554957.1 hypothetical protein [Yersinia ruckeri]